MNFIHIFCISLITIHALFGSKQPLQLSPITEESDTSHNQAPIVSATAKTKKRQRDTPQIDLSAEMFAAVVAEQTIAKKQKSGATLNLRITHETPESVIQRCKDYPSLASAIEAHKIVIRNRETGETTIYLGHTSPTVRIQKKIQEMTASGAVEKEKRVPVQLFSEDDRYFIAAAEDKTVRMWDYATKHARVLKGFSSCVTALAINKKSNVLITGCQDGTLIAWDLINNKKHDMSHWYSAPITTLSFETDSNQFTVEIQNQPTGFWDVHGTGMSCLSEDIPDLDDEVLNVIAQSNNLHGPVTKADSMSMFSNSSSSSTLGNPQLNSSSSSSSSSLNNPVVLLPKKLVQLYPWYYFGWHTQVEIDKAQHNMRDEKTLSAPLPFNFERAERYYHYCLKHVTDNKRHIQLDYWGRYWDVLCVIDAIKDIYVHNWNKKDMERRVHDIEMLVYNRVQSIYQQSLGTTSRQSSSRVSAYLTEHLTQIYLKIQSIRELTPAIYQAQKEAQERDEALIDQAMRKRIEESNSVLSQAFIQKLIDTHNAHEPLCTTSSSSSSSGMQQTASFAPVLSSAPSNIGSTSSSSSGQCQSISASMQIDQETLELARENLGIALCEIRALSWNRRSDSSKKCLIEKALLAIQARFLHDLDRTRAGASLQELASNISSKIMPESIRLEIAKQIELCANFINRKPHELELLLKDYKQQIGQTHDRINFELSQLGQNIFFMDTAMAQDWARTCLYKTLAAADNIREAIQNLTSTYRLGEQINVQQNIGQQEKNILNLYFHKEIAKLTQRAEDAQKLADNCFTRFNTNYKTSELVVVSSNPTIKNLILAYCGSLEHIK